jgi:hypothetical protein
VGNDDGDDDGEDDDTGPGGCPHAATAHRTERSAMRAMVEVRLAMASRTAAGGWFTG